MAPMRRVLHILGRPGVGGIETLALSLLQKQNESGWVKPAVLFSARGGQLAAAFESSGADLHYISDYRRAGRFVRVGKLFELLRQFDILHFHTFSSWPLLFSWLNRPKVLYTIHGNFAIGRTQTGSDLIKRAILRYFLKRRVDFISYNSHHTLEIARSRYRLSGQADGVVYNGIDLGAYEGDARGLDGETARATKGKFVVGTASRFAGFKRIDRLVAGFQRFKGDKDDVCLLLVGDGILRDRLERQVDGAGLRDCTVFTGFRGNVRDYQAAMDVCVVPSMGEPFGLTALEAMAVGAPTIGFGDGGGLSEVIGAAVPENVVADIGALAGRLEEYYSGRGAPVPRAEMLRRLSRFDIAHMSDAFLERYATVLGLDLKRETNAAARPVDCQP